MHKFLSITSVLCLFAFAAAAVPESSLERQLKDLSRAPVDYALAGKWFKVANEIQTAGQRQEALMATGAALIYSKKGDIYQQRIRQMLNDATAFEDEFMENCPDCGGKGESNHPCPACKGTGQCQYANCEGGRHLVHQIQGSHWETCRDCKGSGRCQKCRGEGIIHGKCLRCGGKGKRASMDLVMAAYKKHADLAAKWEQLERERKERERKEAEEKARAEVERKERERKEAEEREQREREDEERRREYEALAAKMRAKGLVDVDGRWMTPGSVRNVAYKIFQIYEPGHALCRDVNGVVFCLLYSADDNQNVAEGDILRNDLFRCGTYSYTTVQNAPSTVRQFAIDLEVAMRENKRQGIH